MNDRASQRIAASRELESRCQRFIGRIAKPLGWTAAERERWRSRVETAREAPSGEAGRLGRQLFQLAPRLRTAAARAEAHRLAALYRLVHDVRRAANADEAFGSAITAARDGVDFETATGFRLDPGTHRLTPVGVFGGHVDLAADFQFDHGAGISSWVAKSRRPILLSALRRDGDEPGAERIASFLCVPVGCGEMTLGVLCLGHRRAGTLTAADRDLMILAGRLLADRLFEQASESAANAAGDEPEARLLSQRIGDEARAAGPGFTLIGLSWPDLAQPSGALTLPPDLRHRVAEWARETGGREATAYPIGGNTVVLLLPRTTPQATRRVAQQLRQEFTREWGAVLPALNLATVLYPKDADTGPGALERLHHLLAAPARPPVRGAAAALVLRAVKPPPVEDLVP